jgi:hypothetical protein
MKCPKELLRAPEKDYKNELAIMTADRDFWKSLAIVLLGMELTLGIMKALF